MWNIIINGFKWMQTKVKASASVLIVATFILLNIAIWWAGPWLVIKGYQPLVTITSRALTSVIFSLSCFAVWGRFNGRA